MTAYKLVFIYNFFKPITIYIFIFSVKEVNDKCSACYPLKACKKTHPYNFMYGCAVLNKPYNYSFAEALLAILTINLVIT